MRELESNGSRSLVECALPGNAAEATLWDAERVSPRGTRGRTSRGARPTAAVSEAGSGPGWVLVCGGVGVGLRQCGVRPRLERVSEPAVLRGCTALNVGSPSNCCSYKCFQEASEANDAVWVSFFTRKAGFS